MAYSGHDQRPKRPRDPNQLAKLIVDISTGELPNDSSKEPESVVCRESTSM